MENKIKRLLDWSNNERPGPYSIEIWPTNRCNLKCKMCGTWARRREDEKSGIFYNPEEESNNELSDELLMSITKTTIEMGAKRFLITGGGEPFVRKEITLEIMQKIKKNELFGNLNTNGSLLSENDIRKIVNIDWNMIMFSIDGPDAETHDYIRGVKGAFERTYKNLKKIQMLKEKLNKEVPKIVFNTVITNRNYEKIEDIIKLADDVGCEDITFIPLIAYDETIEKLKLNDSESRKLQNSIKELISLSNNLSINTNLEDIRKEGIESSNDMNNKIMKMIDSSPNDNIIFSPCYQPFLHLLIKPNGDVSCCCMMESFQDNLKKNNLREIWYGKIFNKMRQNFLNKKIPDDCKTCVLSQYVNNRDIRKNLKSMV